MAAICFEKVSKKFIVHHERPRSFQELVIGAFGRNHSSREELWALQDISLSVEPGETVGLIGPNGSGKSTALKLISRILEPTSGAVSVNGRVSALLELGAGFHPDLTGRENIFLNGSVLGLSGKEMRQRFAEIVDFSELGRFIDMPLKHYSSGMQMRLGFAIAIHVDPDVLLIDEVLAVGDETFQRKCLNRINQFRRQKVAIVFVSHDLQAVRQLCHRVLWLEEGRLMGAGLAREMVDRYLLRSQEKEQSQLAALHQAQDATLRQALEPPVTPQDAARPQPAVCGRSDRWGTREIEISAVRLLRANGEETYVVESGEPLTIEIAYRVNREARSPVFGIGIYRDDGVYCYGTNTAIEGLCTDHLDGAGVVRVAFDGFAFIEGTYSLDVAVHSPAGHPYDYYRSYCTFAVRSRLKDGGVFRPAHRWRLSSETKDER